jgi:aldose 1-epimerase
LAHCEETVFLGEPAYRAGNDRLEMTLVPGWGSNVISLFSREWNRQLLRVPRSVEAYRASPVLYGIPILFPPNRIGDGRFTFQGRTYRLEINERERRNHLHGWAYQRGWELVKAEATGSSAVLETRFDTEKHPEIYEQFPHPFTLSLRYRIEGSTLHKTATIANRGTEAFPWGFGYHTTFRYPVEPGGSLEKCAFSLAAEKQWILDERFLPTGELKKTGITLRLRKGDSLKGCSLDDAFLSSGPSEGRNEAVLRDENAGLIIVYECDEHFRHWVIYNGGGDRGFLCPEPYTWVTNAPNLDLPPSLTGLNILRPGESVSLRSRITVCRIGDL